MTDSRRDPISHAIQALRDTASYAPDEEVMASALELYEIAKGARPHTRSRSSPTAREQLDDGVVNIIVRDKSLVLQYSEVLIEALEPLTLSHIAHRNVDVSPLSLDDAAPAEQEEYVTYASVLIAELKQLNAVLENQRKQHQTRLDSMVTSLGRGFDEFLKSYAKKMGTIAAVATTLAAGQLLYNVGYGREIIEILWSYVKKPG
jgi:hypothetical protein